MDDHELRGTLSIILRSLKKLHEAVDSLHLEYYLVAHDDPLGRPWAWSVARADEWDAMRIAHPEARKVSGLDTLENAKLIAHGLNTTVAPAAGCA